MLAYHSQHLVNGVIKQLMWAMLELLGLGARLLAASMPALMVCKAYCWVTSHASELSTHSQPQHFTEATLQCI